MNALDAMGWLEERGGRWSVRATAATCVVVASVGSVRVAKPVPRLLPTHVDDALVGAVEELQGMHKTAA
ncbi:MAG: hypothetical protein HY898_09315 [Deltaproteobacteria bacterium]|nr:hypothetical protein [Deltaproteobacteria bacterium]